jgi:hypothetical protein
MVLDLQTCHMLLSHSSVAQRKRVGIIIEKVLGSKPNGARLNRLINRVRKTIQVGFLLFFL